MSTTMRFGIFELDTNAMELRKRGVPVRLQEQPCRVLAFLVERPGQIITREELQGQIWGNTFVDFDQSLNKAVNKIREALNDNASAPQYIETVPRRGYRFIALVSVYPQAETPTPVSTGTVELPERARVNRFSFQAVVTGLAIAALVAGMGLTAAVWLRGSKRNTSRKVALVTSSGWGPALSRDGKLLAYTSVIGGGPPHIWEQLTAGGEPSRVTTSSDAETAPQFSPDGTQIAFYSERDGGGIYIASTLHGDPRLLVKTPGAGDMGDLRFSPSGDSILYLQGSKAFTVSLNGGQPVRLAATKNFLVQGGPVWSPNGLELLFFGARASEQNETPMWWIAPIGSGQPRLARLPGAEQNSWAAFAVRAWVQTVDKREWIIYSTANLESWKLWRIGMASGAIEKTPELLAEGNGELGPDGSVSEDGKLAINIWRYAKSIYQIQTGNRGQKIEPTLQLPLPEGGEYSSPSLSRDGKWMSYSAFHVGKPNTILLRDLNSGTDRFLDDKDRRPRLYGATSIAPNGSRVIFERDCKNARSPDDPARPLPCGFTVSAGGSEPQQVCEACTPLGFSSNGSVALLQKYSQTDSNEDRIVALDLRTRIEKDFLSLPDRPVFSASFSWDDRFVAFETVRTKGLAFPQILIAPVRQGSAAKTADWIPVTDGRHSDENPLFSVDGNTIYFTSTRDGSLCIWAQPLDPASKRPLGPPIAFEHFHNEAGRAAAFFKGAGTDLTLSRDKILITLPQIQSDIWMSEFN
jgi:Tol biopolymer transport system component/DNA-binding winged helix-turn-helix (wHTH) protein